MCNACECSTSGINPRQIWREMSDVCEHMLHEGYEAGTDIRYCTKEMPHRFCEIDRCPRLKVEVPEDIFDVYGHYKMVEGEYTTIYRDTKSAALKVKEYVVEEAVEDGRKFVEQDQGWLPYKNGYMIYFVRLRNVTNK